jgi:hypothetical protein
VKAMIVDKIKDNYPLGNLAQNLAFSLQMKGTSSALHLEREGEVLCEISKRIIILYFVNNHGFHET